MKFYYISFVIIIVLLLVISPIYNEADFFAPELFSYGKGYGVQTESIEFYLIFVEWENKNFVFLMYGKKQSDYFSGKVTQVFGQHIGSYAPFDCSSLYVYCYQRQIKDNWRGWLEFRGHNRPFCGGEKIKHPCLMLKGN